MTHAEWLRSEATDAETWDQPGRAERLRAIAAHIEGLEEALRWYEGRVRECGKILSDGKRAQWELESDAGFRARAALSTSAEGEGS